MIDSRTDVYAVLGHPIAHSLSPVVHNRALAHEKINAVYLAFDTTDIAGAVTGIRALGVRGASITLPHKVAVMPHLDRIDPEAQQIGAVNTIINAAGTLTGRNSDCRGALSALQEKTDVAHKRVALIGAGGAARAIGVGLRRHGARVTVVNRSRPSGEALARDLDSDFRPLPELSVHDYQILINTTPVGMSPDPDGMPVPADGLYEGLVVMDIVYNPLRTRLLSGAAAAGCVTIDGLTMFIAQAACQFEWWTGRPAPVELMRQAALEALHH